MSRSRDDKRQWQLRLSVEEDEAAAKLAESRKVSKNDVVRHALRILLRIDREVIDGSRLLIERKNRITPESVEVWMTW